MENENGKKKHPGGRPPIWTDPSVLQKLVDQYFEHEEKPTLAGLACALDISRRTLYNYDEKDKFLYIIKKAREKVEEIYEKYLIYGEKPVGTIFALKNMGWKDRSDVTSNDETLKPTPIVDMPKDVLQHDSNQETVEADKKD